MVDRAVEVTLAGLPPAAEKVVGPEVVSDHLGVPVATLAKWRSEGYGPRYAKVGRHVRYRISDLDLWLDAQMTTPAAS